MPVKKLPRITPYVVRLPCESHGMSRKLARPKRFELLTPRFVVWGLYLIQTPNFMVADAVAVEPVSTPKFPANREIL